MYRSIRFLFLSKALLCALSAVGLPAQCRAPAGAHVLSTPFVGTTVYASLNPPYYGTSLDPGPGIRLDLDLRAAIEITAIGIDVLGDGRTTPIPVPQLVGGENGTLEVWIAPERSVTEPSLFVGSAYRHEPPTPPPAPWQLLSKLPQHRQNLEFAAPDTPSLAKFDPPLRLEQGRYAVVLCAVPRSVAAMRQSSLEATVQSDDRIHLLFTNLNLAPSSPRLESVVMTVQNLGVQSPAFAAKALSALSTPPALPIVAIHYGVMADSAWYERTGLGCSATDENAADLWLEARPRVGAPLCFTTTRLPIDAALNLTVVSQGRTTPFDLSAFAMPGCSAHIALPELASHLQVTDGSTARWQALGSIPATFAGLDLHAQSVQFCTGSPLSTTTSHLLVSNGLCLHFDWN